MKGKIIGIRRNSTGIDLQLKSKRGFVEEASLPMAAYDQIRHDVGKQIVGRKAALKEGQLVFPVRGRVVSASRQGESVSLSVKGKKGSLWTVDVPVAAFLKASKHIGPNPVGFKVRAFGKKIRFWGKGLVARASKTGEGLALVLAMKDGSTRNVLVGGQGYKLKASLHGGKLLVTGKKMKAPKPTMPKTM
jgi:hypothetical protein